MTRLQNEGREILPKCGFGLTGLCCQSCLLGPCRFHPLETEKNAVDCGKEPDIMVASRLFRLLTWEAMDRTARLTSVATGPNTEKMDTSCNDVVWKPIARKYLDRSPSDVDRLPKLLKAWAEKMVFPLLSRDEFTTEVDRLYAGWQFPVLDHPKIHLQGSLVQDLLKSVSKAAIDAGNVEGVLWSCLKMAYISMVAKEIHTDFSQIFESDQNEAVPDSKDNDFKAVLPDRLFEKKVLVITDTSPAETLRLSMRKFKQTTLFPFGRFDDGPTLPDIFRNYSQTDKPRPFSNDTIAIVFSSSPAAVFMPLLLGFNTASYPALPLLGSKKVENFLLNGLQQEIGVSYVPSALPDMDATIKTLQELGR